MGSSLAFNELFSVTSTDVLAAGDRISAMLTGINAFSPLSNETEFFFKTSQIQINGLRLSAIAHSGVYFERSDCRGLDLIIPIEGRNFTEIDGVEYAFNAGETAFLCAREIRHSTVTKSGVNIRLDLERINETCSAMMGFDHKNRVDFNTRTPSLQRDGVAFPTLFKSVFSQIDAVEGNTKILNKLAIDDALYRLCAGLIHTEIFLVDDKHYGKEPHVRIELENLCEWIRAHLTEPISLTQMERRSGLSARVLQYSFQKSFGLSPKYWLRKQRLHAARKVLINATEHITLTSLAYDFCFASPSDFSHYYQQEFGELPSQTIKRLRR